MYFYLIFCLSFGVFNFSCDIINIGLNIVYGKFQRQKLYPFIEKITDALEESRYSQLSAKGLDALREEFGKTGIVDSIRKQIKEYLYHCKFHLPMYISDEYIIVKTEHSKGRHVHSPPPIGISRMDLLRMKMEDEEKQIEKRGFSICEESLEEEGIYEIDEEDEMIEEEEEEESIRRDDAGPIGMTTDTGMETEKRGFCVLSCMALHKGPNLCQFCKQYIPVEEDKRHTMMHKIEAEQKAREKEQVIEYLRYSSEDNFDETEAPRHHVDSSITTIDFDTKDFIEAPDTVWIGGDKRHTLDRYENAESEMETEGKEVEGETEEEFESEEIQEEKTAKKFKHLSMVDSFSTKSRMSKKSIRSGKKDFFPKRERQVCRPSIENDEVRRNYLMYQRMFSVCRDFSEPEDRVSTETETEENEEEEEEVTEEESAFDITSKTSYEICLENRMKSIKDTSKKVVAEEERAKEELVKPESRCRKICNEILQQRMASGASFIRGSKICYEDSFDERSLDRSGKGSSIIDLKKPDSSYILFKKSSKEMETVELETKLREKKMRNIFDNMGKSWIKYYK